MSHPDWFPKAPVEVVGVFKGVLMIPVIVLQAVVKAVGVFKDVLMIPVIVLQAVVEFSRVF